VLVLSIMVRPGPAGLRSAAPGDGERVASAPAQVQLTFSAAPAADTSHVTVVDAAGGSVAAGPPRFTGDAMVLPVDIDRPGTFRVAYHADLGSGVQATGTTSFAVGAGGPVLPAADPNAPAHDHGEADPLTLGVIAVNAVVVLGLLGLAWRRRRQARAAALRAR
jgi:methionine-rich copper-binding protein CopC